MSTLHIMQSPLDLSSILTMRCLRARGAIDIGVPEVEYSVFGDHTILT